MPQNSCNSANWSKNSQESYNYSGLKHRKDLGQSPKVQTGCNETDARLEVKLLSDSPTQKLTISRDEIRGVYAQGENAVIALVEGLLHRTVGLEERVEKLEIS